MLRSCTLLVHIKSTVVESTTKLLVLRCKKAKQSQCPWKLRAMVVKGTTSFAINKYNGPHKCVNPCLNRDHQQLDSNLIAAHIQGMIKAQFTLSVAAIQASIVKKFGYQISYKKASKAKLKALTNLFGDFYKSYAELPQFFIALEQANPGCVVISKTFRGIMENTEIFQRVFWAFHPSIEGFKHCRPVLSIDDRHPGIMAAMSDVHLGWSEPYAYHRVCMRHLAIAQQWLEAIPFEKMALSHDGGRRYGIMTTNMFGGGSHEIVLYDHIRGQFHVKTNKGTKSSSTPGRTYRINLQEYACTCDMEHRGHSSDPDPLDTSVLVLQDRHRSHLVDSGQLASVLTCRQHVSRFMRGVGDGFSLVERWRPETHTFHLPVGEMTITLQDVAVILGLRIHGLPITGTCDIDWSLLCYELLGVTPPISEIRGSAISTRWLCHHSLRPPVDLDDATLERYARAFCRPSILSF
ncbi:Serine/threonine-protein phosphatase 7 long form-like [Vitis vinifera]|uniref:Serine/threonine-protein phosphatase 7 long form-like n=1 Tax=Vitis vinifera TaxID=29760 RepID=A0A438GUG8_VITVI|nr:Serine/threonine-protein phosphatase 7 long form-like [Vitis vinifera]